MIRAHRSLWILVGFTFLHSSWAQEGPTFFRAWRFGEGNGQCIYGIKEGSLHISMVGSDMETVEKAVIPLADIKGPRMFEDDPQTPAVNTALGGWNYMIYLEMQPDKETPPFSGYGKAGPGGYFSIGFDNERDLKLFLSALGAGTNFKAPEYTEPIIVSGPMPSPPPPTPTPTPSSRPSRPPGPGEASSAL